jgi:para-nitrobenzyl esterase
MLVVAGGWAATEKKDGPVVRIDSGSVSGVELESSVTVFRGIPYAAPPVGELRWRPPRAVEPWHGVRPATEFGAACPQPDVLSRVYGTELPTTAEDCLSLNVWTDNLGGEAPRPVMVWIHGGAHYLGWGHQSSYDGEALARRGVVLVTINYRIGALGFLAHPALSAESPEGVSGNYGLLDQIAALEWVQRNIERFGGDPSRVTIFGESAGGGSVLSLMASPLAGGLFHRAICQSGGSGVTYLQHLRRPFGEDESAEAMGVRAAKQLGVAEADDVAAAMRSLTPEQLIAGAPPSIRLVPDDPGYRFRPIVDGWVLPEPAIIAFAEGRQHDVPLLIGSNADEGTVFLAAMALPAEVEAYRDRIRADYGEMADRVLELYPVERPQDIFAAANRTFTDAGQVTPARGVARAMANVPGEAFLYHFTRVRSGLLARLGAFHGSEISFVFQSFSDQAPADEVDASLAEAMASYWVQFAATGDPNRDGLPRWPAYDAASDRHLELGDQIRVGEKLRKEECDLFEAAFATQLEAQAERARDQVSTGGGP